MKKIIISLFLLASSLRTLAFQTSGSGLWTLDSCINYALTHNVEVRQRINSIRQGELAVKEAKDRVLPNLSGYGSENFSFGRGLTADHT